MIKELEAMVRYYGEQRIFADKRGIQAAVVSKALADKYEVLPLSLLGALNLEKVVTVSYRRKK